MPGFESNPQQIPVLIAELYISKILQFFKNIRLGKLFGEIFCPEPDLADVEVADTVVGITRRG